MSLSPLRAPLLHPPFSSLTAISTRHPQEVSWTVVKGRKHTLPDGVEQGCLHNETGWLRNCYRRVDAAWHAISFEQARPPPPPRARAARRLGPPRAVSRCAAPVFGSIWLRYLPQQAMPKRS